MEVGVGLYGVVYYMRWAGGRCWIVWCCICVGRVRITTSNVIYAFLASVWTLHAIPPLLAT